VDRKSVHFQDVKAPTFGPCETQVLFFNMSIRPLTTCGSARYPTRSRDVIPLYGKSLGGADYSRRSRPRAGRR